MTTTQTVEQLQKRKAILEGLIQKFRIIYQKKMIEHDDHVQRAYVAVTTGILSILNKSPKATATYRRSLNSDIQLHRKIQLRNLFLLRMRERTFHIELGLVKEQLAAMGIVDEAPVSDVAETAGVETLESASEEVPVNDLGEANLETNDAPNQESSDEVAGEEAPAAAAADDDELAATESTPAA